MHNAVMEMAKLIREKTEKIGHGYLYVEHLRLGEIFETMFEDFDWDKYSHACGFLTRAEIKSYSTELYCGTECYGPCCAT
tara:strand:- start:604 stop:843 length:240 start_codon:yes stop_codon:yes gene_type:complete